MFTNKINIRSNRSGSLRDDSESCAGAGRVRRGRYVLLDSLKSGVVVLLLLSVVASAIVGSEMALFVTMLVAWSLFPVLVGLRNTLEAGCAFMLISVGVLVVVGVAQSGPGYFVP
ncbi:MAG: hypothetical protein ACRDTR_14255 [Rubrobacter sp.]